MTLNHRIGQQIRTARRLAHLTQKQLGDKLGRSGATIAYLEQGKRRVSPNLLEEIAKYTEKPLSFFYNGGEDASFDMSSQIQRVKDQLQEITAIIVRAEQKCKENASRLAASEAKFQLIFDEASDAMILMGADGAVLEMNKAYEDLLGLKRADVLSKPFWEVPIGSPEERVLFKKAFEMALSAGKAHEHARFPMSTAHGKVIEVDSTSRLLRRGDEVWGLLSILRPVRSPRQLMDLMAA